MKQMETSYEKPLRKQELKLIPFTQEIICWPTPSDIYVWLYCCGKLYLDICQKCKIA